MLGTLLLGSGFGILVAIIASYIALKLYGRSLRNSLIQQQGWEHAQEARQQQWQQQQEKRLLTLEQSLADNLRQIEQEWKAWEQRDALRKQELMQQYQMVAQHAALEHAIEHLPLVEEASLPSTELSRCRESMPSSLQVQLPGANLTGKDLSRRYLAGANLRGATLVDANLFMTDLSGACLAGADLSGADLSGANLIRTDLREATLVGANILVADLNDAVLLGAKLQKIRNLTTEQIITTIHDHTTQFDEEKDITLPRVPGASKLALSESSTPYDIVRAQSLDAVPETPSISELAQEDSLSELLTDEASFIDEDEETSLSTWASTPSEETLRILEEIHLPAQESRRTDNFGRSAHSGELNGRSQVHSS